MSGFEFNVTASVNLNLLDRCDVRESVCASVEAS